MRGPVVRILTLNCLFHSRARARLAVIARLLKEAAPDVACLQEIILRRNVGPLSAERADFRPWGPLVLGGLVTLTRAAVESSTFEVFRTGVWFEWGARKGFLTTRLRIENRPLTVINTHLLANYDEDWRLENRYARKQLDELSQLAAAVNRVPTEQFLVVAGDFNVPLSSPQFGEFMSACGLQPAFDWSRLPGGERGALAIDNVLYREPDGLRVRAAAEVCLRDLVQLADGRSVYPSDHVAVLAELSW